MRTKLALLGLGVGLAASVLPIAPASASCDIYFEGRCYSLSCLLLAPYAIADQTLGDKLPDAYCTF